MRPSGEWKISPGGKYTAFVSVIYFLFGAAWVWGSDYVVMSPILNFSREEIAILSSAKGTLYVFLSTILVFVLAKWSVQRSIEKERIAREAADRLRKAADVAGVMVWVLEWQSMKVARYGHAFSEVWGRPEISSEIRPEAFIEWVFPDDRESVTEAFERLRKGQTVDQEYRIVRPDGSIRWIWDRAIPVTDEVGDLVRVIGVSRDVTERVYDEQLRHSIFNSMLEGFIHCRCVEKDGQIVDFMIEMANRAFSRFTSVESPIGKTISTILPDFGAENSEIFQEIVQTAHGGRPLRFESEIVELDVWVLVTISHSGPGCVVAVLEDISEQKREAQALLEATKAAGAASEAKSRFIATMSHELRTPLNALLGFLDLVKAEAFGPLEGRYIEYAADAAEGGQHLLSLINNILDFSRIEAGKMALELEPLSISRLVESGVRLVLRNAQAREIALVSSVPEGLPLGLGDARASRQIIINLLANAIKFTEPGGRVTISATTVGNTVKIDVMDTGIGIPASKIATVLKPFEQIENHYGRSQGGAGLGLAIANGLALLQGHALQIESEFGKGTTATMILDIASLPMETGLS